MKKSLVLAMALAMGVTASAYAANPFSDVPAGHWAYDAVDKLAAAGVIDGMGDGTFQGDKTMTRYEMAQIVAKAMAKGANVEKLAAEFADELDQLGVRVAKLEKKADNVTITGEVRYDYNDSQRDYGKFENIAKAAGVGGHKVNYHRLQTRIFVKGQINEDWTYNARIQNRQDFTDNVGNNTADFNQAWVSGKLGGVKVNAGRQPMYMADGNLYDDDMDAVKVSYGKNVKVTAYVAKPTEGHINEWGLFGTTGVTFQKAYGLQVSSKFGAVTARIAYDSFRDGEATTFRTEDAGNDNVWNIGVAGDIGKLNLNATYLKASTDLDHVSGGIDGTRANAFDASTTGLILGAKYGAATDAKVGSWGVWAKYYNQGVGTFLAHTMNGQAGNFGLEGFSGYGLGVEYTFAKNIQGFVEYYDLKGKESDSKDKTLFGRLQFHF